ncbi:hypothetical protein Salat_1739000 [Sesamum alatum]|uniref:Uncharacterized protein n=1 Tax=Sesamum alatum TaxID=300844 RepID=A0AAE2CKF8_9LAMI|nr:hypothetical protein Salat_1739000 [Sesamum alatum]
MRHVLSWRSLPSHRSQAAAAMLGFAKQPAGRTGSAAGRGSTCYHRPDFLVLAKHGTFPAFTGSFSAHNTSMFQGCFSYFRPLSDWPEVVLAWAHCTTGLTAAPVIFMTCLPSEQVQPVLGPATAYSTAATAAPFLFCIGSLHLQLQAAFPYCTCPFHDRHPTRRCSFACTTSSVRI